MQDQSDANVHLRITLIEHDMGRIETDLTNLKAWRRSVNGSITTFSEQMGGIRRDFRDMSETTRLLNKTLWDMTQDSHSSYNEWVMTGVKLLVAFGLGLVSMQLVG